MIKEYLTQIDTAVFLSYGTLVVFFALFITIAWKAYHMDSEEVKTLERMPLDM